KDADFRVVSVTQRERVTKFAVQRPGFDKPLELTINMPGLHNVLNATAAVVVATDEKLSDQDIQQGVENFQGVGRRFDVQGELTCAGNGKVMLVDDYGHHPTEVAANIRAIRDGWPERRLVMIYQPHRYTRTRDLYDDFV